MSTFVNLLPSIVSALAGILAFFSADIQGFIAAHPAVAAILGAVYAIFTHILPSPASK